ncbi:hypothetical protein [Sphingobacterium sp. UBA6320]|nr:hypothetical protein [Sphingobacterium sp. UBA6320]
MENLTFENFELEVQTICSVDNISYGIWGEMIETGVTVSSSMII